MNFLMTVFHVAVLAAPFITVWILYQSWYQTKYVVNPKIEKFWHMRDEAVAKLDPADRPSYAVPQAVSAVVANATVQEQVVKVYVKNFHGLDTAVMHVKDSARDFEQLGFPDLALHLRRALKRTNFWIPDAPTLQITRIRLISLLEQRLK